MKKLFFILITLFISTTTFSQVYNDAKTLSTKTISLGVTPVIQSNNGGFALFADAGIGFGGADLDFIVGFGEPNYFGANIEFMLLRRSPYLSVAVGGHTQGGVVGLDGTLNLSFPITRNVGLYGGIDADMNFYSGSTTMPAWFFVGTNIALQRNIEFMIEVAPAITNANSIFGLGLKVYL